MRAVQSAQSKLQAGGASLARGAQQQQQQQQQYHLHHNNHYHHHQQPPPPLEYERVVVKQEAGESGGEEAPPTLQSRLRKTIMDRREAKGLGDIPSASSPSPVQHELTEEEIRKKERRKEQNRRAAKKCRMKKKILQSSVQDDYVKMVEDNRKLEKESTILRAEVNSLKKQLDEHLQSGQCRQNMLDNAGHVKPSMTSSSSTSSFTSTSSSTMYSSPSPSCVQASSTVDPLKVSNELYLQDFGQISPDQTFTDLELDTLVNLAQFTSLEDLTYLAEYPAIPQPDANDNLKTLSLQPASPQSYYPTSPATTNPDRLSVSSVASSDWSAVSDQSPGFGLVPTDGGSPVMGRVGVARQLTATSLSSTGEWDHDLNSPQTFYLPGTAVGVPMETDLNDLEDDVFADKYNG